MSLKSFTLACLCLFFSAKSLAQLPPPCPSNAFPPADVCADACVYCNLISINSTTAGYTSQTPPGFCGTIESEQWIGFTASASTATFTATPTGCAYGYGIQIALYESCSSQPLHCYAGCGECANIPASITADNLVPGQVYFLMIDGFAGDQCDFTLTSNPPVLGNIGSPLGAPGAIVGPDTTCVRATDIFQVPTVAGIIDYIWDAPPGTTINGEIPPTRTSAPIATVRWGDVDGEICVSAANACATSVATCKSVKFRADTASTTVLPDVKICSNQAPYLLPWGDSVWFTGIYELELTNVRGCDSTVRQSVTVQQPKITDLGSVRLCTGDCLTVFGQEYCQPNTNLSVGGLTADGCDSIVQFIIVPAPKTDALIMPPSSLSITCWQPSVELTSHASFLVYSTQWIDGQGVVVGTSPFFTATEPGLYTLQLISTPGSPGCKSTTQILVKQNTMTPTLVASGGTITLQNPLVQLKAHSVNSPVKYRWTGPQGFISTLQNPLANVAGTYTVTVTNTQTGCSNSAQVVVSQ